MVINDVWCLKHHIYFMALHQATLGLPNGKRLLPPIDFCNTKGFANGLPDLKDPFFFHILILRKTLGAHTTTCTNKGEKIS